MARKTNTREQVRIIADQLSEAGKTPTPTLIRQMLGTGSPNTIVDELRAWSQERQSKAPRKSVGDAVAPPAAATTAEALSRVGAAEAADLILQAVQAASLLSESISTVKGVTADLTGLPPKFAQFFSHVQTLVETVKADRAWYQAEIDKAYSRFESVQKYSLLQIAAAREETAELKARTKDNDGSAFSRELAYKRQNNELREQLAHLQGRLAEQGKPYKDIVPPPLLD